MALFYGSTRRDTDLGKFPARRHSLMPGGSNQECGDYRLELLTTETTTPTRRTRYHVRILGKRNARVAYLRDYQSPQSALEAARQWVENREQAIRLHKEGC